MNSKCYRFGDYTLDVGRRELACSAEPVAVERKVLDLLIYLIEHRERMVHKDELQDAVWPGTIVTETALSRAIMKARRAVNDNADEQAVIKTVHGQGYRFVAEVVPESITETRPGRTRTFVSVTLLVVLSMATLILMLARSPEPASDIRSPRAAPPPAMAVLPFHNLSPDPEHAYFASGIHQEIINEIARGTDIRVIARRSVTRYLNTSMNIPEIASELGVDSIVEGSIRYADGRVRITAQLIDGKTGVNIWSRSYDRHFSDIFAIQSDIAHKVAAALQAEVFDEFSRPVDPASVPAYREYLIARSLRDRTFAIGWDPVLAHTQRSLEYDPYFLPSLWLLHNAYQNRIVGDSHADAHKMMKTITARAVERDPDHALTLMLQAKDAAYEWRWQDSKKLWDRAMSADPTDPVIHGDAAFINLGAGDYGHAEAIINRAIRNNPGHDWPLYAHLLLSRAAGDTPAFLDTARLIISMGGNRAFPAAVSLCFYYVDQRDPEAVSRFGEVMVQMAGEPLQEFVDQLVDLASGEQVPVESFRSLIEANPTPNAYKWMIVQLYLLAGDRNLALEALDDIASSRALFSVIRVVTDPAFSALHREKRYQEFLEAVGLVGREGWPARRLKVGSY